MPRDAAAAHPYLVGGRLCLDFCNTIDDRAGRPVEHLRDYGDLVSWSVLSGILNEEEAARLRRTARRSPTEALAVVARAVALREAIHDVVAATAGGEEAGAEALETLNAELGSAMARSQVVAAERGFTWVWADGGRALDSMLWPIARSAADLLTGGDVAAVRECMGRGCGWLFLDTSRNRTRRWCDMRTCGNRAKARRHHARAKVPA